MSSPAHSDTGAAKAVPWLALATFLGFAKLIVFVLDSNPQVFLGVGAFAAQIYAKRAARS